MIIRFEISSSGKGTTAKADHNKERLQWIADAKEGRTLDEIQNHPKHYNNTASDLNYDLHNHRIYIVLEDH